MIVSGATSGVPTSSLDLSVCVERDVTRVPLVHLAVVQSDHMAGCRANRVRSERQAPFVEEVAQRVGALDRGLDVDDAIGRVSVQPVEAGAGGDERALGCVLGSPASTASTSTNTKPRAASTF